MKTKVLKNQKLINLYFTAFLTIMMGFSFPVIASGETYYINSIDGNDSNNGTSQATAWKTIAKVNLLSFSPGDSILFNADNIFSGELDIKNSGSPGKPVTISSYGNGRATINAGNGNGIHWVNSSFAVVKNLNIYGSGVSNVGNGVFFENQSGKTQQSILIDHVEAFDFGFINDTRLGCGIAVTGSSPYIDITIQNCSCHGNMELGIQVYGSKTNYFRKLIIQDCTANDNEGNPNFTGNWSGTGIFVAFTDSGLVQRCTTNSNGAKNQSTGGGPCGNFFWNCNNMILQYCIACDNEDPTHSDGGGFDIDNGNNNTIQYCYSRNNVGPGFMINSSHPHNATLRYNISENDCTSGHYAAMTVGPNNDAINNQVYNNIVYKPGGKVFSADTDGVPSEIQIFNNIFVGSTADWGKYTYGNNCYWGGITSLATDSNSINADPLFVNPGAGGDGFNTFDGYKHQSGSPCIGAGKVISNNGGKDFWGNVLHS